MCKKSIFGSFRPVDGYRVFHRERRTDRYAAFQVRTLPKAVTDLIIGNLEEDLEYEVYYTHLHKTIYVVILVLFFILFNQQLLFSRYLSNLFLER